jgi:hypothetical protein
VVVLDVLAHQLRERLVVVDVENGNSGFEHELETISRSPCRDASLAPPRSKVYQLKHARHISVLIVVASLTPRYECAIRAVHLAYRFCQPTESGRSGCMDSIANPYQ